MQADICGIEKTGKYRCDQMTRESRAMHFLCKLSEGRLSSFRAPVLLQHCTGFSSQYYIIQYYYYTVLQYIL